MMRVYLSSTYSDLKEYREVVRHALGRMQFDVVLMENYVATDQRPVMKCLADVAACDVYIGLFAWRYGYIPPEENPEHKSITELEYRQARRLGKSCLIFLLAEDAQWTPTLMDAVTGEGNRGASITTLRHELAQEEIVSFYKSPDHLASLVAPALHLWEKSLYRSATNASSLVGTTKQSEIAEREAKLRAILADHSNFIQSRLESFVGREAELTEIRQRIEELRVTGGYVTITGQAGQGKSSIIAKFVEEKGKEQVAFHFIPFNPGPDHQIGLLRNLMARLILKYGLSDLYIASESRVALREYFPKVLKEITAKGDREVIFIDGLDQLEEDLNGIRDLSFLPTDPPSGIVFVLGTRPDDTLRPLELLKPYDEYKLPGLSRQDFDLILRHRKVHLERELADQFYQVMQENALYLDLVARELQEKTTYTPDEIIARIAHNPENIFSLKMERLKRQRIEWREVLKPILGVLLVAREPLSVWQIRQLIQVEDDRLRDGLVRLGGLIAESGDSGQKHYSLFHLMLEQFLRQDEHHPQKEYIFATDEEEQWHATFTLWCEKGQLALIWEDTKDLREISRREYARKHYVAHLYFARKWQQLFALLDEGSFGHAKDRYDVTTRSYIQDLDWGQKAAAWEGWSKEESMEHLPYLWRYTLLRCSLRSRADQYPFIIFQLLLLLRRVSEALGFAELLTNIPFKVAVFLEIAKHMAQMKTQQSESIQILFRAYETSRSEQSRSTRVGLLRELATALVEAQQGEQAAPLWVEAETVARTIEKSVSRDYALRELATVLTKAERWEQAAAVALTIEDSKYKASALLNLVKALKMDEYEILLKIIQRSWLLAETKEHALQILLLASVFISLKPQIAVGFLEAFKWVDTFLNGEIGVSS